MSDCSLDKCQLKDDVTSIKTTQGTLVGDVGEIKNSYNDTQKIVGGMAVDFGKMTQKLEDYMDRGRDEHDALFRKTSQVVKWPHLSGALVALSIIVTLVWKFAVH